ncbi:hypothetical protein U1Q18_007985, partial [Sarracenia purpurea var. burkii]
MTPRFAGSPIPVRRLTIQTDGLAIRRTRLENLIIGFSQAVIFDLRVSAQIQSSFNPDTSPNKMGSTHPLASCRYDGGTANSPSIQPESGPSCRSNRKRKRPRRRKSRTQYSSINPGDADNHQVFKKIEDDEDLDSVPSPPVSRTISREGSRSSTFLNKMRASFLNFDVPSSLSAKFLIPNIKVSISPFSHAPDSKISAPDNTPAPANAQELVGNAGNADNAGNAGNDDIASNVDYAQELVCNAPVSIPNVGNAADNSASDNVV